MNTKTITVAVVIFALVIIGMFVFAYLKKSEIEEPPVATEPQEEQPAGPYDYIDRIEAKHFYIDGSHTLAGEVLMPTACDLLSWDTTIAESFPEQVTVNFDALNESESCAQVLTPQRFKVSFDASQDALISATFEGRDVELNLIPAAEGETPDDFELFIKG